MTRGRSAGSERRSELETRLLDAVTSLLGAHSYTELSIQQIADAAGVGRSTFYWHFPDKTALLLKLATRATDELLAFGGEWGAHAYEVGVDGLRATLLEMISVYRRHAPILRAITELAAYEPSIGANWRNLIDGIATATGGELITLQADGRIGAAVDVAGTTHALALMVERSIAEHTSQRPPEADADHAALLSRMVWLCYFGDVGDNAAEHG